MIYLLNKNKRRQVSPHFHSAEFECPCCGYAIVDERLAQALTKIREYMGRTIKVTSGYRCPHQNAQVGGAEYSKHLTGMAADITWPGADLMLTGSSPFRHDIVALTQIWGGTIKGIGWGRDFMHVDVDETRGHLTQWDY